MDNKTQDMMDRAKEAGRDVKDAAKDMGREVKDAAKDIGRDAKDAAQDVKDKAQSAANDVKSDLDKGAVRDDYSALKADLEALRGDVTSLVGNLRGSAGGVASNVVEGLKGKGETVARQALDVVSHAKDRGGEWAIQLEETVRQRPLTSVLVAFGAGLLLSRMMSR